jgi:hypothetical protein
LKLTISLRNQVPLSGQLKLRRRSSDESYFGKYSACNEEWIRRKPGSRMHFDTRIFSAAKNGAMMFGVEQSSETIVRLEGRSGMVDDEIRLKNERFS